MKYDMKAIAGAIRKAKESAAELAGEPDGGSCNMDEAYIYVPGMRESAARSIGCRILQSRLFGRLLMVGGGSGRGARNTAMAERICESLKTQGYDAGVWYQAD